MTILKAYDLIRTYGDGSDGPVLGRVIQRPEGWRFIPNTCAHGPSRKPHPTFDACIPRWTGHPDRTRSVLVTKKDS